MFLSNVFKDIRHSRLSVRPILIPKLFIDGVENSSKLKYIEKKDKTRSSIVIPLLGKIDILGILNINRVNTVDFFTQSDLQKANIFGSQIALAIENALFFQELEKTQTELFQAAKMSIHAAMIDRMDREIGRVLEQLKKMVAGLKAR